MKVVRKRSFSTDICDINSVNSFAVAVGGLDEELKRRKGNSELPRVASFGPMSVAGSSYNDLRSGSSSQRSDRDKFEDCLSVDTRSFILSDSGATSPPLAEGYHTDTDTKSNYTDARSNFSETQSRPWTSRV